MGKMHTKAERTEKVEEIKAENRKKVKEIRAKKKELDAEVKKKARQVAADRKKRRAGITFRLFMLAIVPVIVMVLGLITTTVFSLKSGLEEEAMIKPQLIQISRELGIPMVATNDVHYVRKEDAKAHDVLLAIQTATSINDENRMRFSQ